MAGPNPPPVWNQYYPGGSQQQAADWNAAQHSGIYQDPGTHAGPTGPTGPTGSGSAVAAFRAVAGGGQAIPNSVLTRVNFPNVVFQTGAGNFDSINSIWSPPSTGIVFMYAQITQVGNAGPNQISIRKNGTPIATMQTPNQNANMPLCVCVVDAVLGPNVYDVAVAGIGGTIPGNELCFFAGTLLA